MSKTRKPQKPVTPGQYPPAGVTLQRRPDGSTAVEVRGRWVCCVARDYLKAWDTHPFAPFGQLLELSRGELRFVNTSVLGLVFPWIERRRPANGWALAVGREAQRSALIRRKSIDPGMLLWLGRYLASETGWPLCEESATELLREAVRRVFRPPFTQKLLPLLAEPRSLGVLMSVLQEPWLEWDVVWNRFLDIFEAARGPALARIREVLATESHPDQVAALELLSYFPGEASHQLRSRYLRHPNPLVRRAAVDRLREYDAETLAHLRVLVLDDDPKIAAPAAVLLGDQDSEAVTPLCKAVKSPHPEVQIAAAKALGDRGNPEAISPIAEALEARLAEEHRGPVVFTLMEALQHLGKKECVPALALALQNPDTEIRTAAAGCLGLPQVPEAVPYLIPVMLKDPEIPVATVAAQSLVEIGDPAAGAAFVQALGHASWEVRAEATRGVGRFGSPKAGAALDHALGDLYPEVRVGAALALQQIALRFPEQAFRLRGAIPALRRLAGAWSGDTREARGAYRAALAQMDGATTHVDQLPLPAADLDARREELPVPASPAAPASEDLPLPS